MRTVHTLDELLMLPRDRLVNGFRARAEVRLEIPDVERSAQVRAQEALNELQENSGALAGAVCMLATLIYGVVRVIQRHESLFSLRAVAELLAVLALASLLGFAARFTASACTRLQFARRCRALHRALAGERDSSHNPMIVRI
jgi:hypothetical protein